MIEARTICAYFGAFRETEKKNDDSSQMTHNVSLPSFLSWAAVVSVVSLCEEESFDQSILKTEKNNTVAIRSNNFFGMS